MPEQIAVTEDAPAVSTELETPKSLDEALETGFLPDDPSYRLTGEFKSEKTEEPKQEEPPAPSGEQDAETAAASETAQTQEQPQAEKKTPQTSESRWAKLSRENRELREENARIRRAQEAAAPRETKQESQPATPPRPKIDDVDATGKPKFATYEDYENARDEWNRNEAIRQFQETSAKTQREQQIAQAKETIARTFNEKCVTARTKYADFDEVALNPDLPIKEGSVTDVFTLDSQHGTDVLYYLGQHPEELARINTLNPIAQARELVKIELKLSGQSPAPVKRITSAPPPPHQVSGKGTVAKDAVEQAVEDGDSETYIRAANARQLARLKGK